MHEGAVTPARAVDGVLFDLLMGVMDSLTTWSAAAHDRQRGLAWRDHVTAQVVASGSYAPYEAMVARAAQEIGLPATATDELTHRWSGMQPWPDAMAISALPLPYAFVTNCSAELAQVAARRSGLDPLFTLSAQEAGWFKPEDRIYREACRRLGTTLERTLFVAGSPYDAVGARAAGLPTWLVLRRSDQRAPGESISVARTLDAVVDAIHRP